MATDFFQQQDAARRRTGRLLVLYALGVAALVVAAYLVLILLLQFTGDNKPKAGFTLWRPELLGLTALGVGVTVGLGSLWKLAELSRTGGRGVAESLGGSEVPANAPDASRRRLLNVVEEMSLAAGCRMPSVYVLESEDGINAFAAGFRTDTAVVAVSRGCMEYLTRDELQGVIAHEFSHILNGDMRLNLRLIGLLHGIMMLALLGEIAFRLAGTGSNRRSSRDKGKSDNVRLIITVAGLALMILGWVGVLFGRLIQSAVSRQREYLADASAVQFTRNPDGIAGALKKIGGLAEGSALKDPQAGEAAHLFFASGIKSRLLDPFATHPPLDDRIRRIDSAFDGTWPEVSALIVPDEPRARNVARKKSMGGLHSLPGLPDIPLPLFGVNLAEAEGESIGPVRVARIALDLPDELRAAAGEPFQARALVLALLLDDRPEVRSKQALAVAAGGDPLLAAEVTALADRVAELPAATRLPLADLCISALRQMSAGQYASFRERIGELIAADDRTGVFEYALRTVVLAALDHRFGWPTPVTDARSTLAGLRPQLVPLLSRLARETHPMRAAEAFAAGVEAYRPGQPPLGDLPAEESSLEGFDKALRSFAAASPAVRRAVLAACVACVHHDAVATTRERELLRAVAAALDCPGPMTHDEPQAVPLAGR